jgi:integrase
MSQRRRETPLKRTNPSGKTVYVARWTNRKGERKYGWPPEIKGTHTLRRDAQKAIDACYELEDKGAARPDTVGAYAAAWTREHPKARVTDKTNNSRLRAVLDVKLEGVALGDWTFDRLRRRHANLLVDVMLREQGRARSGALNILGTLSAMTEDAINDEVAVANPFRGVRIRANDPRIQKASKPVRVFDWPTMHAFARACAHGTKGGRELAAWRAVYAEPMVRVLSDCGLRAGELLGLERADLDVKAGTLSVTRTVSLGEIEEGTKTDHGQLDAGRVVPVPPELLGMLKRMMMAAPARSTPLLFPTPRGCLWNYSTWWRDVWVPGAVVAGSDIRPHEMRHSYVSLMRAAGVDAADLADVAGHTVETATARYTHGLGRSFEAIKEAVGT